MEDLEINDWADWIVWMMLHYDCYAREIAERLDVTESYISQIKCRRRFPSKAIQACLASYAVDHGPRPPAVELTGPLKALLDTSDA
jgi:transcriptional regulator with XRE-family HTH domain